jgi:hypothetical protein
LFVAFAAITLIAKQVRLRQIDHLVAATVHHGA